MKTIQDVVNEIQTRTGLTFQDIINESTTNSKLVLGWSCGTGKSVLTDVLVSVVNDEGFVIISNTIDNIRQHVINLIDLGVPEEEILQYHSGSDNSQVDSETIANYRIVFCTSQRIYLEPYNIFHTWSGKNRKYLIIDEAVPPVVTFENSVTWFEGLLRAVNWSLDNPIILSDQEIKEALEIIHPILDRNSVLSFEKTGSICLGVHNWVSDSKKLDEYRYYGSSLAASQILAGKYRLPLVKGKTPILLTSISPQVAWYSAFEKVICLDATAFLTESLYSDFHIDERPFNFNNINDVIWVLTSHRSTRTSLAKYRESFFKYEVPYIRDDILPILGNNPYTISFNDFQSDLKVTMNAEVNDYGANKGSNKFMTCDSFMAIGSYRMNLDYIKLAKQVYPTFNHIDYSVANLLQEISRTRFRSDQPINIGLVGDNEVTLRLLEVIDKLPTCTTATQANEKFIGIVDDLLNKKKRKLQATLIGLITNCEGRELDLREIATKYCGRHIDKVYRAINAIKETNQALGSQLVIDTKQETLKLVTLTDPVKHKPYNTNLYK